ncbi:MAG TPA: hypothetical protein VHA12_03555 [Candidatus Nanoarchaeia archaeon]|nr:hypothetical protein [Candidatus Nanoarchaeia archaeon]
MKSQFKIYLTLIVLFIVILTVSSILLFNNTRIVETKRLNVKYEVGERAGFNVEAENLNFGRLIPGNSGTRSISIYNEHSFPIKAKMTFSENLLGKLICNCSSQILLPNETRVFPITLKTSRDEKTGNYTGFIEVKIFSS